MEGARGLTLGQALAGAVGTALAYVGFFLLNDWLFSRVKVSDYVSWIFLPAAIRMLSVLLFGWAAVAGLFIGSLAMLAGPLAHEPVHALFLALLSSVPALVAARLVQRTVGVQDDLAGMTGRHLVVFGLAGGLTSSLVHTVYFMGYHRSLDVVHDFWPMLIGDTVGTLITLYLGALALRRLRGRAVEA